MDPHTVHLRGGRPAPPAQTQHLDRATGSDQRLRLAPDAGILLVVGVDDHEDRPRSGGGTRTARHAPVDQPAPNRRTWRLWATCPRELPTVSTMRLDSS